MMRSRLLVVSLMLIVAACSGEPAAAPTTMAPGAGSPLAAVEQLQSNLAAGDFEAASALAVPKQAALASLAEGATFGEVANALRNGDSAVASNFWNGFAQGVGEVFAGGVDKEDAGSQVESGIEFFLVAVVPTPGLPRRLVTQDIDGHRVDLFASFGAGLADRMISPVQLLVGSTTPDAALIVGELQAVVPSLLVAAGEDGLPPESVQAILQLVELITRVG